MVNDGNNKAKIIYEAILLALRAKLSRSGSKFLALSSLLLALCFISGWILYPDMANSGPYLNSAHGTSYGVNRSSLSSFGYSVGNCAHCHEQHASIGGDEPAPDNDDPSKYALFSTLFTGQSEMFCYGCHSGSLESLQQIPIPANFSFSYRHGGATGLTCPGDIKTAFQYEDPNTANPYCSIPTFGSSAHSLTSIQTFLMNKWGFSPTEADNINPCSGCHNPHYAQRLFPCSRPEHHDDPVWELWGDFDNATERMGANYQSPNNAVSGLEEDTFPSGTLRTPRFITLCQDCHNMTGTGRTVIRWGQAVHGTANASTASGFGGLKPPYSSATTTTYNLNCTDCHEPHGSRNEYLLRYEVNGVTDIKIAKDNGTYSSGHWYNFCTACHTYDTTQGAHDPTRFEPPLDSARDIDCSVCHRHGTVF